MKKMAVLALAPMLLANQFTAGQFEFSAHFMSLIQQHKLAAARRMLAPSAVIKSWQDYDGPARSFESFAAYITKCPVHDFEGVDTNDAHVINVNLDCESNSDGASLKFKGGLISEIDYGGPPPLVQTNSPAP